MVNCNQIPVEECLTECPDTYCTVRDLRFAVRNTDYVDLVEQALDDHWMTAYDHGVADTLDDIKDGVKDFTILSYKGNI